MRSFAWFTAHTQATPMCQRFARGEESKSTCISGGHLSQTEQRTRLRMYLSRKRSLCTLASVSNCTRKRTSFSVRLAYSSRSLVFSVLLFNSWEMNYDDGGTHAAFPSECVCVCV
jgi:hypothetical protein